MTSIVRKIRIYCLKTLILFGHYYFCSDSDYGWTQSLSIIIRGGGGVNPRRLGDRILFFLRCRHFL